MPWCPKCKAEYQDGYSTCRDCGCELVEELEQEKQEEIEYDQEVFLTSVRDEIEASIIEVKLAQSCIPIMKKHKETGAYLSIYMGATPFGIDLYVPSKSYDLAKELVMGIETVDDSETMIDDLNENDISEEIEALEDDGDEKSLEELDKSYTQERRSRVWIIILFIMPGLIWLLAMLISESIKRYLDL
jgi:hypothetical protein